MNITKDTIIGDIVANDYRAAAVFKESGIDFCCHGNRTIQEACNEDNIDADKVIELLVAGPQGSTAAVDYRTWPLDLLADYIEKKHHRYVRAKIQEIQPYLSKICRVHGDRHPELWEINDLFNESAEELTIHMEKEEDRVFPIVRKMMEGNVANADLENLQASIEEMMSEHDNEGERFRKISALSNHFTTPADGCNTYKVTLNLLHEFEEDLHLHIHLENNILFPKALDGAKSIVTI
ncbi:MAG: iron-sulfur cluster repair di-iron protein [Saprospiraceae bacterium]|nr:MAG: iron-sulfur cluster repair di-iron protein [Bacteroidetes bacterium OLB9]MCO6463236.1 iron-sulfur cluster repair di-iron protein [Saprospiraceae bacterium]MCZ2338338.1 iron-sulfur cluster repair di-iron protein [Chitinophagales bacterium]